MFLDRFRVATIGVPVIVLLVSNVCIATEDENHSARSCDVGAARMDSNAAYGFDPIPAVSLHLNSTVGSGFQVRCEFGFKQSGWFVRGSYNQTDGHIAVRLRLDDEVATGRFDLHQRLADIDVGYRAELRPGTSILVSLGYTGSWFEPDDFLLVLPSGGAQFDHKGALEESDGGVTITSGIRWQTTERLGIDVQVRYRDRSAYVLTNAGLNSEVLGRVGAVAKLTDSVQLLLENTVGEQSRSMYAGFRWSF